jgi:hypothetical protein
MIKVLHLPICCKFEKEPNDASEGREGRLARDGSMLEVKERRLEG